jgi:uncharacterized protein YceH (UPF0502 family)
MPLDIRLDPTEARIFGVLIEKALTTPDQYPLSVNGAMLGANQKSNREPVLSLSEDEVVMALERLVQKYMARKVFPANSRAEKYCHNGKDALAVEMPQLAILAELLMRGPQTPGELRTRVTRMSPIDSLDQLTAYLGPLQERNFIRRLPPAPGSRAERYEQLLSPDLHPLEAPAGAYATAGRHDEGEAAPNARALLARVETLESHVTELRQQVQILMERLTPRDAP